MIGLTPRQRDVLAAICAYQDEHHVSPSYEEIASAIGLKAKSRIVYMVRFLEEKGYVRRHPLLPRSIDILHRPTWTKRPPLGMSPGPDLTINGERWMTFRVEGVA